MIDILLLAIVAVVTWMVASDGPWGGAITFVSVLLSGLFAMNYFEPLAGFLGSTVLTSYDWQHRWDVIALLGLFSGGVFGLRMLGEFLLPTYAELHPLVYVFARWGFAVLTGYVVMAVICTSLHVAPLQREYLGFTAERRNFFGLGPDRQFLALTQYASEKSLRKTQRDGSPAIFDGVTFPSIPGDASTNQIWSSFPIRYAARRERFASGAASAVAPQAEPVEAPGGPAAPVPVGPGAGTGGF